MDGNSPGSFSQNLTLAAGSYVLTFDLSGNPDGPPLTKTLDVSVGGANQVFTYTIGANTHADMMYTPETLDFTATGPTTLTFASLDPLSPYGPVVGDVSVTSAVPEAGAWATMLLGLGLAGAALRRRLALAA